MRLRVKLIFVLIYGLLAMDYRLSYADTMILKDGKELKGVIVEDYQDRIIISTVDGEMAVMKDDVGSVYYDNEDENLIKFAERARERRDYSKAYGYYERALHLNPNSKAAKDGMVFCQSYVMRGQEVKKEDDVRRREEFERYGGFLGAGKPGVSSEEDAALKLDSIFGLRLKTGNGNPRVVSVKPRSTAYDAGVRADDTIIAIWGRLAGYMSLEEVIKTLLEKPSLEMKITIERTVDVMVNPRRGALSGLNDLVGANFVMKFDGLTVDKVIDGSSAADAGLKGGDLITAINGQNTRYMPLKKAIETVRDTKGQTAKITFRRELTMWRAK